MNFNVIFISGVHGVGKGTLGQKLSSYFGYPIFSASTLIKKEKNAEVDKNKVVIDADKNQDYLISALNKLNINSDFIILDGHFCLQGDKGIIEIPLGTYKGINLSAVILLVDKPSAIYERLYSRDNTALDLKVLQHLQDGEKEHARFVVDSLNVPIIEANLTDSKTIAEWLASVLPVTNN